MKLSIFQADAFAEDLFCGNPAAVIPLPDWLPDRIMQNIAMENNLSETAFFVPGETGYHLRWFTPTTEVSLCGHATLATAHILFRHLNYPGDLLLHIYFSDTSITRERQSASIPGRGSFPFRGKITCFALISLFPHSKPFRLRRDLRQGLG